MKRSVRQARFGHLARKASRATGVVRLSVAAALSAGALAGMAALSAPAAQAATLTVTNLTDSSLAGGCPAGPAPGGSLRAAIAAASPGDTITFANGLTGTITLACDLEITKSLTISGPGANVITVSGSNLPSEFPDFVVDPSVTATISGLTIANATNFSFGGFSGDGGGICNSGTLFATGDSFSNNLANGSQMGGAIANEPGCLASFGASSPVATLTSDAFNGNNTDAGAGGAIFNAAGFHITVVNDTFFNNYNGTGTIGGAIYNLGDATLTNLTFSQNVAHGGPGGGGAGGMGGAIYNGPVATAVLQNLLLSGLANGTSRNAPNNCVNAAGGILTDQGGNIDDDGSCGLSTGAKSISDAVDSQISLSSFALNSPGTTNTEAIPDTSIAHKFAPANCPPADQRGVNRPNPDGCDSGAYQIPFESTQCSPPTNPLNLTGAPGSGGNMLNWMPPTNAGCPPLSYDVFRFTQGTTAALIASQITALSYLDPNVMGGMTYFYYVEAVNPFGMSAPSNQVSVTATTTPPPPPPPAGSCSSYTGNSAFVCAVYVDILGRTPDSGGLNTWNQALANGTSRTQVALDIIDSAESATVYIQGDYEGLLGRPADSGGLSTWLSLLEAGGRVEQVDAGILGSAEFFSDAGGTNNSFINAVYQDLLGRPVDSGGLATWSQALANGVSRTQVAYAIDTSNEAFTDDVQFFYQDFLGRAADPGGLSTWVGALNSGATVQQVIAAIMGSQEFFNNAPSV